MKRFIQFFVMTLALLAMSQTAGAQTFTIEASHNDNTNKTTFTITRSGSSLPAQTINFRTVNLSAYAGVHYTAVSDSYTFPEGITTKQVEVSENSQYSSIYGYHYQTGTTRSYRFEVLDVNGFELAHNDRSMTTGAQFSTNYLNQSVTDLVYFTNSGSISSGSGNKYLDVSYSSSNWTQVTDAGYDQGVHTVSTNSLYNNNSSLRTILNNLSYKMYATVYFTQKEEHDGYQYIQIYTGSSYDNVDDPNGGIGTLTNSLYRACFILSKDASVMSSSHYQFFPHRYNYVDKAAETAAGISHYEFDYSDSYLYEQKFKSNSYKASTSGSLVLSPTANNINIRFDAGGGGTDHDEWDFKDLKVRLALVDETYPTLLSTNAITVSAGPYVKGNTFYISVPFSEIVKTANYSGNKKLVTTWGDATYDSGDGTNVITFKGTINANAGTTLEITSVQCNFKDLAENLYQGIGNSNYTDSFDKTFNGVSCTDTYTLAATNTEFTGLDGDYWVSDIEHQPQPHPTTVYFYKGIVNTTNRVTLSETTNYTLAWADNTSAGTGTVTASGTGSYTSSISTTFPIRWATYTVHFDKNHDGATGTGTMSDQPFTYATAQNLTANAFTRTGYDFAGWNTAADGSGDSYTDGQEVNNLTPVDGATVTLYAQWTAHTYTVRFHSNDGTEATTDQAFTYDEAQNLTANAFTRTGYTFAGWSTTPEGDVAYTDGQEVNNLTAVDEAVFDLYAQWTVHTYTVRFHSNDGTDATTDQPFTYDEAQNLTANAFTRTGYDFAGWNTAADGSGDSYTDEEEVNNLTAVDGATVTLYAQWTAHTYTVHFDKNHNDATGTGEMSDMSFTYDEAQNLTANAFTRMGYDFAGWSTTPDGDVAYTDGEEVNNLTAVDEAVFDLYAQWTAHTYTVHFDKNHNDATGTGEMSDMSFTYDEAQNLTANAFTRTGYTFAGWSTAADGSGDSYTEEEEVNNLTAVDGDVINLYAQWTAHTYTVRLHHNDGTDDYTDMAMTYNTAANIQTFSRTGYTFDRWTTGADGSGTTYTEEQEVLNLTATDGEVIDLYAQWTAHTYTVHFDKNHDGATGTGEMSDMSFTYDTAQNLTANAFTRTGYTFAGWNTLSDGTGDSYTEEEEVNNLTAVDGATVTLYAQWRINTYTVRLHSNDGTDATTDQPFTYDEAQNLTANAFTRTGCTFDGWNTAADGTGDGYTDGQEVNNLTLVDDAVFDLYAQWNDVWGVKNGADGSEEHPYVITTTAGLDLLASDVNSGINEYGGKYFKLGADIAYTYTTDWNDATSTENNYTAIGHSNKAFCGIFDGDGHTVSGIRIYQPNADYRGLFGRVWAGTVKNVTLTDARIRGYDYVGGITGQINGGATIQDCLVLNTTIQSTTGYHAGVVIGHVYNGTLSNNHYHGCIVNGTQNAVNVGTNYGDKDGARSVHTLTLPTDVTATGENVTISGATYYASNTTITLYYEGTVPEGTAPVFTGTCSNGDVVQTANTFQMPASDVTVSVAMGETYALILPDDVSATGITTMSGGITYVVIGTTVTLTYNRTPPEGFIVDSFDVKDADDNDVTVTESSGTYTFEMPASDATVSVTFADVWGIAGGADGSEEHPYLITTTEGLDLLAARVNSGNEYFNTYFKLGADIAYTYTTDWDDANSTENNYTAIGNYSMDFGGIFDGDGHTVSGIRIYQPDTNYRGLFGRVYAGTVKNVILTDARITGNQYVGGIAGQINGGATIQDCLVLNTAIPSASSNRGAVIGNLSDGTLSTNYYHGCTVNGTANAVNVGIGGGDLNGARSVHTLTLPTDVTATGENVTIDGVSYYAANTPVTLNYEGTVPDGTVPLFTVTYSNGEIVQTFNTFEMPATDVTVRVVMGEAYTLTLPDDVSATGITTTIDDNEYFLSGTIVTLTYTGTLDFGQSPAYSMNGTPIEGNTFEMPAENVTVSVNFTDLWDIADGADGSEEHPYVITTPEGLQLLSTYAENNDTYNMYFQLGADIDMSGVTDFTPIGQYYWFEGTFDGADHTISHLTIDRGGNDYYIGLFGVVYEGTVCNLTLDGATITGYSDVGGIAGSGMYASISNCHVISSVIRGKYYIGAIGGIVYQCSCSGNTYHSTLVYGDTYYGYHDGGDAFNIGVVDYYDDNWDVYYGDMYGSFELDATKLFLSDGRDNSDLIAAYADPYNHTYYDDDYAPDLSNLEVTLQGRTLWKDKGWNTLCLPFYLENFAGTPLEGATVKTLASSSFSKGILTLNFETVTSIVAGQPYIVKWESGDHLVNPVFSGVAITYTLTDIETDIVTFVGTYNPVDFGTKENRTVLLMGANNNLFYPDGTANSYVNAFRGYFQLHDGYVCGEPTGGDTGIKEFIVNFDGEATGIQNSELRIQNEEWYTIDGRRLSGKPAVKGVYINNGKKVFIK